MPIGDGVLKIGDQSKLRISLRAPNEATDFQKC